MIFPLFDNKPWFAPKRFGVGSGLPIVWQGWALIAVHMAAVLCLAVLLHKNMVAQIAVTVAVVLLPLPLYAAKTRGGWRWRSGEPD